jgi:hypothetical protein
MQSHLKSSIKVAISLLQLSPSQSFSILFLSSNHLSRSLFAKWLLLFVSSGSFVYVYTFCTRTGTGTGKRREADGRLFATSVSVSS